MNSKGEKREEKIKVNYHETWPESALSSSRAPVGRARGSQQGLRDSHLTVAVHLLTPHHELQTPLSHASDRQLSFVHCGSHQCVVRLIRFVNVVTSMFSS